MDKIVHNMVQFVNIKCYFTNGFLLLLFIEFVPILSTLSLLLMLECKIPVNEFIGVGSLILDCSTTSELNLGLLTILLVNFHFNYIVFITKVGSATILIESRTVIRIFIFATQGEALRQSFCFLVHLIGDKHLIS